MKKFLIILLAVIALAVSLAFITGNQHIFKAVLSTYLVGEKGPTIDDYTKFVNRTVETGQAQEWPLSSNYNKISIAPELEDTLESYKTIAFAVFQNDSLLFEQYWEDYSRDSYTNSFSVAKSLVGICVGAALKDGSIESLDQKVADFIPEYRQGEKSKISIRNLLTMSSGIDFGENYNDPFGFMAKAYYGTNLYPLTVEKDLEHKPGSVWKYQGGNTLLLSFVLEKATDMSLSEYFSEKIWKPIGAAKDALWTVDKKSGREKSYCCFYSNARDFARIGKLYMQKGVWNEDTLLPSWYVKESVLPVNIPTEAGKNVDYYGFQWWIVPNWDNKVFYARGIQGQYIVVVPDEDLIIVRLGRERDPARDAVVPMDLYFYLRIALEMAEKNS